MANKSDKIDEIVFNNIKQLGIEIGDKVNMINIDKMLLYSITVYCVNIISKGNSIDIPELPSQLPKAMAECFRVL
jgi:hypothetical protein